MIIWLHGAFGAGKSSAAGAIASLRPDVVMFDPETVGFLLRSVLPVDSGDFQDLSEWRELVVATGAAIEGGGRRFVVAPMSLLTERYAQEISVGFRKKNVDVFHVLLDASEDELRRRINGDESDEHGDAVQEVRAWRLDHIEKYLRARSWLAAMVDLVVDTTNLDKPSVGKVILEEASVR